MSLTLIQRLDLFFRKMIPAEFTFFMILLSILPMRIPEYAYIKPSFAMIPVFYWAIYRPDLFGQISAFVTGLFLDLLEGGPLGVNAFVFLIIYSSIITQRRFFAGKPFGVSWWGFSIVAVGAVFGQWFLSSLIYGGITSFKMAVFSYLLTVCMYPVVGWVCAWIQSAVLSEV